MELNHNSCRFCLQITDGAVDIVETKYFCIDRRLIPSENVFETLDLKVSDESSNPTLPRKICEECKKTISTFYSLKKSFKENEAILLGKNDSKFEDDDSVDNEESLIPLVREFMKDHESRSFKVMKYSDKLVIDLSKEDTDKDQPKLQVFLYDRPSSDIICEKCCERFNNKSKFLRHKKSCNPTLDPDKTFPDFEVEETDNSNLSNSTSATNQEFHEESPNLENDEEDGMDDDFHIQDMSQDDFMMNEEIQVANELLQSDEETTEKQPENIKIKTEPDDCKFACQFCGKKFFSRSGRDTHQQLKHRVPENFDENDFEDDFVQETTETGEVVEFWVCKICGKIGKTKDNHIVHMKRHAIRFEVKQEPKPGTCFVIMKNQDFKPNTNEMEMIEKQIVELEANISGESEILKVLSPQIIFEDNLPEQKIFACPECSSAYKTEKEALIHIQQFAAYDLCTTAVCKDCNVVFPTEKLYHRHREFHDLKEVFQFFDFSKLICSLCCTFFTTKKDLEQHVISCQIIGKAAVKNEFLVLPDGSEVLFEKVYRKSLESDHHCGFCAVTGDKDFMNTHMTLFHAALTCPFDNQPFGRRLLYFLDHMKIKHAEHFSQQMSFPCSHCELVFPSKREMLEHCRSCDSKKFGCTHCSQTFVNERTLKEHLNKVQGIRNFKCQQCEKAYTNKADLNIHARKHDNTKPYTCTFPGCQKSFRTNSHRSSHMDTHSTGENYPCSMCKMKFKTRGSRRVHEKKHVLPSHTCDLCLKEFSQNSHLIRHVNVVHQINCKASNLVEALKSAKKQMESQRKSS